MMEDVSVSKGVFVHAKYKIGQKRKDHQRYNHKNEQWYKVFKKTWSAIEEVAAEVNTNSFRQILSNLENFVTKVRDLPLLNDEIPTGILLAGVNLPDHDILLDKVVSRLRPVTPYIATVWSRDAASLKNLIEETVYQIINDSREENEFNDSPIVKKSQCTFYTLHAWHKENNNGDTPLVIIIPDFESFSSNILHDFVLTLSSYWKTIKFVLIFGVATTVHIVHRSLSYDATSKLNIKVFHTQTQVQSLSDVLDSVVLTSEIPFKLTGRAFKFLVDKFLYYDFSVNSFLQSYKVCMWRHFYGQNEKIICCKPEHIKSRVSDLVSKDLAYLKKLPSVENYLKSVPEIKNDNNKFKKKLVDLLKEFHEYMKNFLIILKCLYEVTINFPNAPFGKNFREIYALAVGNSNLCETQAYKETIKMVGFLSKEEILSNIKLILSILNESEFDQKDFVDKLEYFMNEIKKASLDIEVSKAEPEKFEGNIKKRLEFTEYLKSKSQKKQYSPYKELQMKLIEYLDKELFTKYLKSPCQVPLNEIFCYDDRNTVYNYIRGSMKAAIYNGLNDPHFYLDCDCCKSENDNILPTFPDISIIFKLHLEARKMINMYDWLQSFLAIIDSSKTDEQQDIDPLVHARFTRAVAELQFLGFIKSTRKKTDHVKRLT